MPWSGATSAGAWRNSATCSEPQSRTLPFVFRNQRCSSGFFTFILSQDDRFRALVWSGGLGRKEGLPVIRPEFLRSRLSRNAAAWIVSESGLKFHRANVVMYL